MANKITECFGIRYPLIQAGMVWCAPWELAAAVSNAGGLGIIGAASMYPEVLRTHIRRCREHTAAPFAVNVPLIYPDIEEQMQVITEEEVPVVFTSAGNPKKWTGYLKEKGCQVVHVVSSVKFAVKAEEAGVDAVVAEGFEAGGHNGREETTTFCLIPMVAQAVRIPLIAAGGVATGRGMLAAMVLGADGVQMGSRFVASRESSAHEAFKNKVIDAREGATVLTLKELTPVRLLRNAFYDEVADAYSRGASQDELRQLLGRGRSKKGMFEGDLDEGELEIGQVAGMIDQVWPAAEIVHEVMKEYEEARREVAGQEKYLSFEEG